MEYGIGGYGDSTYKGMNAQELWTKFFHKNINKMPYAGNYLDEINSLYNDLSEEKVVGLINFILEKNLPRREKIKDNFNSILEENNAPYRIINDKVQPFLDKEITAIFENAYHHAPNEIIRNHLKNAEQLYSDPNGFNYRTSCQELINALEACLHFIYKNNKKLSDNISNLKKDPAVNLHLHKSLDAINNFRGDVTAHAVKNDGYTPSQDDALLIHTLCCAYIYYFRNRQIK